MNLEKLKQILDKIPIQLVLVVFAIWMAYSYYDFMGADDSPLKMKEKQVEVLKKENADLQTKIKQNEEFLRTLEDRKAKLRDMAVQLDQMKATLSEEFDVGAFVKAIVSEAAKSGLKVLGIKPAKIRTAEYYAEQGFDFKFQGVYVQLVLFLERLSSIERIARVDDFSLVKKGSSLSPYVEIGGTLQIKGYRYVGSKADEIAKNPGQPEAPKAGVKK